MCTKIQGQISKSTNHFFHILYHAMPHVTLLNSGKCASHPHMSRCFINMASEQYFLSLSSVDNVSDQHIILKYREGNNYIGAIIPEESNIDDALYIPRDGHSCNDCNFNYITDTPTHSVLSLVFVHEVTIVHYKLLGLSSDDPFSSLFTVIRVLLGGDIVEYLFYQLFLPCV